MDFVTYIQSLPNLKSDTIEQIAKATCSSTQAVYRWLRGDNAVPAVKRKIIADLLGIPESDLWPNEKKKK